MDYLLNLYKAEIEKHEKENAELKVQIRELEETIDELNAEISGLWDDLQRTQKDYDNLDNFGGW